MPTSVKHLMCFSFNSVTSSTEKKNPSDKRNHVKKNQSLAFQMGNCNQRQQHKIEMILRQCVEEKVHNETSFHFCCNTFIVWKCLPMAVAPRLRHARIYCTNFRLKADLYGKTTEIDWSLFNFYLCLLLHIILRCTREICCALHFSAFDFSFPCCSQ